MISQTCQRVLARLQQVRGSRTEGGRDDAEAVISSFFRSYSAAAGSGGPRLLELLPRAVAAVRAARFLIVLTMAVSDSAEGRIIRRGLAHLGRRTHKTAFIRIPLHEVATVLILPMTTGQYAIGSSKQTLRRKARAAERAGVHWAPLDDVAERRRLIALSETREGHHPQGRYRSENADNSRLLDVGLWLVAYSKENSPLLMAVVPTDGEWSMLSYFCTLEDSTAASNARYLMSWVLAEELVDRGVRYLVDTATMSNLSDGLRHFQHMLGYQMVRVRLSSTRRRKHVPSRGRPDVSPRSPATSFDSEDPCRIGAVTSGPRATAPAPTAPAPAPAPQVEPAASRG